MSKQKKRFSSLTVLKNSNSSKKKHGYSFSKTLKNKKPKRFFSRTILKENTQNSKISFVSSIYFFLVIQAANLSFVVILFKFIGSGPTKFIFNSLAEGYDQSGIIQSLESRIQLLDIENIHLKSQVQLSDRNSHPNSPVSLNITNGQGPSSNMFWYATALILVGGVVYVMFFTDMGLSGAMNSSKNYFSSGNVIQKDLLDSSTQNTTNLMTQNTINVKKILAALDLQNAFFNQAQATFHSVSIKLSTMLCNQNTSTSDNVDDTEKPKEDIPINWEE